MDFIQKVTKSIGIEFITPKSRNGNSLSRSELEGRIGNTIRKQLKERGRDIDNQIDKIITRNVSAIKVDEIPLKKERARQREIRKSPSSPASRELRNIPTDKELKYTVTVFNKKEMFRRVALIIWRLMNATPVDEPYKKIYYIERLQKATIVKSVQKYQRENGRWALKRRMLKKGLVRIEKKHKPDNESLREDWRFQIGGKTGNLELSLADFQEEWFDNAYNDAVIDEMIRIISAKSEGKIKGVFRTFKITSVSNPEKFKTLEYGLYKKLDTIKRKETRGGNETSGRVKYYEGGIKPSGSPLKHPHGVKNGYSVQAPMGMFRLVMKELEVIESINAEAKKAVNVVQKEIDTNSQLKELYSEIVSQALVTDYISKKMDEYKYNIEQLKFDPNTDWKYPPTVPSGRKASYKSSRDSSISKIVSNYYQGTISREMSKALEDSGYMTSDEHKESMEWVKIENARNRKQISYRQKKEDGTIENFNRQQRTNEAKEEKKRAEYVKNREESAEKKIEEYKKKFEKEIESFGVKNPLPRNLAKGLDDFYVAISDLDDTSRMPNLTDEAKKKYMEQFKLINEIIVSDFASREVQETLLEAKDTEWYVDFLDANNYMASNSWLLYSEINKIKVNIQNEFNKHKREIDKVIKEEEKSKPKSKELKSQRAMTKAMSDNAPSPPEGCSAPFKSGVRWMARDSRGHVYTYYPNLNNGSWVET